MIGVGRDQTPGRQLADDRIKWKLGNLVWRRVEEVSKFRHIGATGDRADTNIESRLLRQGQRILGRQNLPTWDVTHAFKYSGGRDKAVKCKM